MVRVSASPSLLAAAGFCGLYCSYAGAVVAKPGNLSSRVNSTGVHGGSVHSTHSQDALETSQTRVNQVDGPPPSDGLRSSVNRASSKDYDGGSGGYSVHNTYGPPRDYYYDERQPEYFRPQHGGYHPPSDVIYHQHPHPEYSHPPSGGGGGEGHRPGELNIQPLLLPLAGISLLAVLSALVKTPLLLHLGAVGRRRRRSVADDTGITAETIKSLLEKFEDRKRLGDSRPCLVCDVVASIYDRESACVERSVCEVMSRDGPGGAETDKRLLTAMIAQVVENRQVPEEFRKRLESARKSGGNAVDCRKMYPCAGNGTRTRA